MSLLSDPFALSRLHDELRACPLHAQAWRRSAEQSGAPAAILAPRLRKAFVT
jgi:hypothetical protein